MKGGWKNDNYAAMMRDMTAANRKTVKVGIATPKQHFRKGRGSVSMAQLYQWHEEGTRDNHVPARPTLRPTFKRYKILLSTKFAKNLMISAADSRRNTNSVLVDIGATYSKLVKYSIMNLSSPRLQPYTIANRVNKGTSNPLVDQSQLMDDIGYSIK
ncbi:hypothetical protein N9043_01110 [bacterium]|nr:hypothetical protein [bacterium]